MLTPQEIDDFCKILINLKARGKTIIFISHKLAEVMKLSDQITVLRLGKVMGTVQAKDVDTEDITLMMVGRHIDQGRKKRKDI